MTPNQYRDAAFEEVLKIGKATDNLTRLKILYELSQGRKSVEQLAKTIAISIGTTSKNLQLLKKINLVKENKDKNFVFYTLASSKVASLLSLIIDLSEENLSSMQQLNKEYNSLPQISISELKREFVMSEPYILDVRPEDEFAQGHLPYAHNLPYTEFDTALVPKNQNIIVYCRGRLCGYAEKIGRQLVQEGCQVKVFNHTVKEWQLAQ